MADDLPENHKINSCSNDPAAKGTQELMTAYAIHQLASGLEIIEQISHGFSVGDILLETELGYMKALANNEATFGRFIVTDVIDDDHVEICSSGTNLKIENDNFYNVIEEHKIYMTSNSASGKAIATDSADAASYTMRNPVFIVRKKEIIDNVKTVTIDMLPWRPDIGPHTETFTLQFTAGDHGTVTGELEQSVLAGESGTAVTAVPDNGYVFSRWSDGSTANPRTNEYIMSDVIAQAIFTPPQVTLRYEIEDGIGEITGDTLQIVNVGDSGTPVQATVFVGGYHFVRWSDGNTNASRTDTNVTQDLTVTAIYEKNSYIVKFLRNNTHLTLDGEVTQHIEYGNDSSVVTAIPDTGYHFTGWSNGEEYPSIQITNVTSSVTVTAYCEIDTYTLNYAAGEHGSITGNVSQEVEYLQNGTEVTAVPDTGYHFVRWSDGNTNASRTDLNVTGNIGVIAEFAATSHTVRFISGSNGGLSGTLVQNVPDGGSTSPVSTAADVGYHFTQWDDGNVDDPRVINNVTQDITVTAEFAINEYTVNYTTDGDGTISGNNPQIIDHGGSGSEVVAVPNPGYQFDKWLEDGLPTANRTDTNITESTTYTASFVKRVDEYSNVEIGNGQMATPYRMHTFMNSDELILLGEVPSSGGNDYLGTTPSGYGPLSITLPSKYSNIKKVVTAGTDIFILYEDGDLYFRGLNNNGVSGLGHSNIVGSFTLSATNVVDVEIAAQSAAYSKNTSAMILKQLGDDTIVMVSGYNRGNLGSGTNVDVIETTANSYGEYWKDVTPAPEGTPVSVRSIYLGGGYLAEQLHSAIITNDGNVWTTGYNDNGQLGIGSTTNSNVFQLVTLPSGETAKKIQLNQQISTDSGLTMILTDSGKIYAMGSAVAHNFNSELSVKQTSPVCMFDNSTGNDAIDIICSDLTTPRMFYIDINNTIYAIGKNDSGLLGVGDTADRSSWTPISVLVNKAKLLVLMGSDDASSDDNVALCVTTDNKIYTWGDGDNACIGDGSTTDQNAPVDITSEFTSLLNIADIKIIKAIETTGGPCWLIQDTNDNVIGWGSNGYQILTVDSNVLSENMPKQVYP